MVTVRNIAETIVGLKRIARDLRATSESQPVEGLTPAAVLARSSGLLQHALYLEGVADELLQLVPEEEVELPEG